MDLAVSWLEEAFDRELFEFRLARFGPDLVNLGLDPAQINQQNLETLEASLERVNDAIAHPDAFGTYTYNPEARISVWARPGSTVTVGILPLLLSSKAEIIERIRILRPEKQLSLTRDDVLRMIPDINVRTKVRDVFAAHEDNGRVQAKELDLQAAEANLFTRRLALQERAARIASETKAKNAEIYKSWLARETVAGAIGAILLFSLALTLIIAMFKHTAVSGVISDSFLIILGYFFGNTVTSTPRTEVTTAPPRDDN